MKEVKDYHNQLEQIQSELHVAGISHEGKSAEEVYAEALAKIHIDEGKILEGNQVVTSLLTRCFLWVEIIEER